MCYFYQIFLSYLHKTIYFQKSARLMFSICPKNEPHLVLFLFYGVVFSFHHQNRYSHLRTCVHCVQARCICRLSFTKKRHLFCQDNYLAGQSSKILTKQYMIQLNTRPALMLSNFLNSTKQIYLLRQTQKQTFLKVVGRKINSYKAQTFGSKIICYFFKKKKTPRKIRTCLK